MKISITIPVYNEAGILEACIKKLDVFLKQKKYDYEIIIADNASTDKTSEISKEICRKYHKARYIRLKEKGRGRALKKAWSSSNADVLCYMDSDLATDLNALPKVVAAFKEHFDIAIGSRLVRGASVKRSFLREVLSRGYNLILKMYLGVHFKDAQCGFKAINRTILRSIVPRIEDNEWFFDTELLVLAEKAGFKIKEIPVIWTEAGTIKKSTGESNKKTERKSKVNLLKTISAYLRSVRRLRKETRKN